MAAAPLLRRHAAPMAVLAAGLALYPKRSVFADSIEEARLARKPIYDAPADTRITPQDVHDTTLASAPVSPTSTPSRPTPTDRLAAQIKSTRLFLHHYAAQTEQSINTALTRTLELESDVASTVASLAPPRGSGERLLPGAVYVLVAAMAGSIITRNRNVLLRATVPLVTGATAAHYTLPITTRNVEDLAWKYEQRFPVIRDNHLLVRERIERFVETGKAHSQMGVEMAKEKVQGVQASVEDWVRKGK